MKFILMIAFLVNGQAQYGPFTWGDIDTRTPDVFTSEAACEAKFADLAEPLLATAQAEHETADVKLFYICHDVTPGAPA